MKSITSIVAGSLLAVLIAGGASTTQLQAQNAPGEIFAVPFAFTVGGQEIKPGRYEVRRDASEYAISIQNLQTGEKQLFSVRPEERSAVPAKGLLVFRQCGDRKDLAEFHIRGTSLYSATIQLHKKNSELERCSHSDMTTLAAR
jgi:hypothetical protein